MNKTSIEWVKNPDGTQGYTWNPITGCLNGCEYCYARKLADGRLKSRYLANTNFYAPSSMKSETIKRGNDPFYPRFWEDRLLKPAKGLSAYIRTKPRGIFVCDMSDLFGIGIPEEWTRRVLDDCRVYSKHRFYLLTKQPQNLIKFCPFPDNCWVGVTVTDRYQAHNAFNHLQSVEAKVKYISFEPLLDDAMQALYCWSLVRLVDWVIIGAQTKPNKQPLSAWVREIIEACDKAGVPVFIKHNMNSENLPANAFNKDGLVRQEMPK